MFRLGPTELMILLVIVVILFGAGRIGKIAGELGQGLRNFREAVKEDKPAEDTKND
ncbi:MAG: twin-arginine translocase TatA/TatE family subunit [Chloroflexota bacterium]